MKRFLLWLLVTAGLYTGLAVPYHLYLDAHPRRIAVAVDTSYEMDGTRVSVRETLLEIASTRYAVFSLHTEKVREHGWQEELETDPQLVAYGPRDLRALVDPARYPEILEADRLIVLTNAPDTRPLGTRPGLQVIRTQ